MLQQQCDKTPGYDILMVMADMSATAKVGKDIKSDTMYALYEEWYGGKGGWKIIIPGDRQKIQI